MNIALKPILRRAPILAAAIIQGFAFYLSWRVANGQPVLAIALQSVSAGFLTWVVRLPRWWIALQTAFPLCAALALAAPIPSWTYLLAFIALLLIYGNLFSSRVPLYLSNADTLKALDRWLASSSVRTFMDLGCGTGTVLHHLAARHASMRFEGAERALLPYAMTWWKSCRQPNLACQWRDLWKMDLRQADVVYAFLSPIVMERLWRHACTHMRPGSYLISRAFDIPGVAPAEIVSAGDALLYIWRIPSRA